MFTFTTTYTGVCSLAWFIAQTHAQTYTLSACATQGGVVNCLRDGTTVPWTTLASSTSLSSSSPTTTAVPATTTSAVTSSGTSSEVTALSDCHMHGTVQYCVAGETEYIVQATATGSTALPTAYTDCHSHDTELYCMSPDGDEVLVETEEHAEEDHTEDSHASGTASSATASAMSSASNCHFHAGVEHCTGGSESEESTSCGIVERNFNIPLRIGLLFVIMATSAIGVFVPIFVASTTRFKSSGFILMILKQFGTGVIISTALVHLFTHAELLFGNECLGVLQYEATTAAIVMAGIILSFLPDYIGKRVVMYREAKAHSTAPVPAGSGADAKRPSARSQTSDDTSSSTLCKEPVTQAKLKVIILEAGVVFHSILIGITLVVAGDSFFLTLFAVILFHQMFEGLALGSRIGELTIRLGEKMIMGIIFALITPIGMAIGIGSLNHFNGNDPSTIVAIGTLNALSAGILLWVGLVEMLGHDWFHGHLASAPLSRVIPGAISLIAGMALMSFLGKWA